MMGTCVKYTFFLFNILCLIFGFATLLVGIWINLDANSFVDTGRSIANRENVIINKESNDMIKRFAQGSVVNDFSHVMIAIGVFVIITSFLGCYGSIRKFSTLLVVYGILLLVLIFGQVGGAIAAMNITSPTSKINLEMKEILMRSIREDYGKNESKSITELWDITMKEQQCCGVNSFDDFGEANHFDGKVIPQACCKITSDSVADCTSDPKPDNSNMNVGCYPIFVKWVKDNLLQIIGLLFAIAAFELLAIVSAIVICKHTSNRRNIPRY